MLSLNEQQLTACQQHNMNHFRDKMIQFLRSSHPDQIFNIVDEQLQQYVQSGIINAMQYHIKMEQDICRYLEYSLFYGWDFERSPSTSWITELLMNHHINGTTKMDKIELSMESHSNARMHTNDHTKHSYSQYP